MVTGHHIPGTLQIQKSNTSTVLRGGTHLGWSYHLTLCKRPVVGDSKFTWPWI